MEIEKIEGIVLRSQDYKESHRIITLFTPEGLISLIVRGISRKNSRLLTLTTPFCNAEYLYRKTHSELLSFRDGTVLDDHLSLRHSLASLQLAGSLANAILTSQMAGKPAPALYLLYKAYHKQASHFPNPGALLASFYLKLLKYEGHLTLSPHCAQCGSPNPSRLYEGESFCSCTPRGLIFTPSEWQLLLHLDNATHFSSLDLTIAPSLPQKISTLLK